jgi:hypothetical protein
LQIRGIASKVRGDLSFVLELEELGCVTLMPFSHLLPSQQVQLFMEADMEVPSFIYQGKELRNTGYVGQEAAAAMQVGTRPLQSDRACACAFGCCRNARVSA